MSTDTPDFNDLSNRELLERMSEELDDDLELTQLAKSALAQLEEKS